MRNIFVLAFSLILQVGVMGQQPILQQLKDRGEAIVTIPYSELNKIPDPGRFSIDAIKDSLITIYVNESQYLYLQNLAIPLTSVPATTIKAKVAMANSLSEMQDWNTYPTYDLYVSMMNNFATQFPGRCRLDTIGTSVNGRLILSLEITNQTGAGQIKPEVLFTSSMHGDELTGYVLMLRLADYLLNNSTLSQVNELLNGLQIVINPLSNPDGTYFSGNSTVSGATRFNANSIDLNRNYPDPVAGNHPDGNSWQPENVAMMDYMKDHYFILSANLHGGAEVLNYPWDSKVERHPDDTWFQLICRSYADIVHQIDPYYMTDLDNGITNGYDWYQVYGGRQDYVTHFLHGREVTMEVSSVKLPDGSELPGYWEKNYQSLLNYLNQALFGITGKVTNEQGVPLMAKVSVLNHDKDSSFVRTDANGIYFRMLKAGTYSLNFEANGYVSQEIDGVDVTDFSRIELPVVLKKVTSICDQFNDDMEIYPNPVQAGHPITIITNELNPETITILNLQGKVVFQVDNPVNQLLIDNLPSGVYFVKRYSINKEQQVKPLIIE